MKAWIKGLVASSLLVAVNSCGPAASTSSEKASPAPTTVPFATVAPIIATNCAPCHSTTFVGNQDAVYAQRAQIATDLQNNVMPPAYANKPLTAADRALLVQYVNQFP